MDDQARRIDVITKVSLLSSYVALPREGHLNAAIHIIVHIGQRYNSRLVSGHLYPEIDQSFLRNVIIQSFIRMSRKLYL